MDKLQLVLNAAVPVVTGTWKSDRGLGQILHDELHWLDVPDRFFQAGSDSSPVSERLRTAVAGLTVWNSLWDFIRDPTIIADCFRVRRLLKAYLIAIAFSALEVLDDNRAL